MVHSQFSLSWDSYKSNICSGFSSLQQHGEFVDMTIAADGHFVKVHQMLVALASPYLKDLITSAPCQHPVIFLNNVSHRVLCLLLEYIYTGEVVVPAENLSSFADTAKSLHIRGLENIGTGSPIPVKMATHMQHMPQVDESEQCAVSGKQLTSTAQKLHEVGLPSNSTKIFIKHGPSIISNQSISNSSNQKEEMHDYSDLMDESTTHDDDDDTYKLDNSANKSMYQSPSSDKSSTKLQFTVSIRGSLQVILNRYIYNLHSSTRTGVRRWRCVDYRNNKCSAYLVTKGSVVLNRANLHNHAFHDKKILSKIERKAIYSAIEEVECYREKENEEEQNLNKSAEEHENTLGDDTFTLEFADAIDVKAQSVKS